ncbi:hypothetical protein DFAR_2470002 [Desulfarculales bacterium]
MSYEDVKKSAMQTLEATWWLFDREEGMDDLYEKAGESLDKIVETLIDESTGAPIEIFRGRDQAKRIFLARFEFPKYQEDFTFPAAVFVEEKENVVGFIDFLAGFPIDCCEMLLSIGEFSTLPEKVKVKAGRIIVAPVPEKFFEWPDPNKILFNLTALPVKNYAKVMAPNLEGEPKPKKLHWWFRVNMRLTEINSDGR